MKLYYGLKNLRSIDLSSVELRPLTILLGENNVGKSTVLRSIPLLKQTIEANNGVSTMWKGEYVDYGDYSTAVKFDHENDGIAFQFGIENFSVCNELMYYGRQHVGISTDFELFMKDQVNIRVLVANADNKTYRKESCICIPEYNIEFCIRFSGHEKFEGALFNGERLPDALQNLLFRFPNRHLFSYVLPLTSIQDDVIFKDLLEVGHLFLREVGNILTIATGVRPQNAGILKESIRILEYPVLDKNSLTKLAESAIQPFQEFYLKQIKSPDKDLKSLNVICGLSTAIATYNQLVQIYGVFISKSIYIGPTRHGIKRLHQVEPITKMVISHDGRNLADFLASLDDDLITEFSEWLNYYFEIGISIEKQNGLARINVINSNGRKVHIADSGFGISEFLPYLAQIWFESQRIQELPTVSKSSGSGRFRESTQIDMFQLIAVEQPELHLHPKHQANLADMFAKVVNLPNVKDNAQTVKPMYIVETHSEAIVNRLGELVEYGEISHDDIQILIFSKQTKKGQEVVNIRTSEYNEKGYLTDWPYGFFKYKPGPRP